MTKTKTTIIALVSVVALALAGCDKIKGGPNGPTPNPQPEVLSGVVINDNGTLPGTLELPEGWSDNGLPGGIIEFKINSRLPGLNGTARIGEDFWWNWTVRTTMPEVTIAFRKFSERPEPWDGNPTEMVGERVENMRLASTYRATTASSPVTDTRGNRIQGPEQIGWVRFYFYASNGNGGGSRIFAAMDVEHNWNFTN